MGGPVADTSRKRVSQCRFMCMGQRPFEERTVLSLTRSQLARRCAYLNGAATDRPTISEQLAFWMCRRRVPHVAKPMKPTVSILAPAGRKFFSSLSQNVYSSVNAVGILYRGDAEEAEVQFRLLSACSAALRLEPAFPSAMILIGINHREGVNPMGHMMNGRWVDDDRITADVRGAFVRADSQFRNWVTPDGSAGPSGSDGFKPSRDVIIFSFRTIVRGRIGLSSSASLRN